MAEKIQLNFAGKPLSFDVGNLARQSDGAVLAQYGETVVLAATVTSKKDIEGKDFFPLLVDYRERMYAGGKMPGGFFKREGKQRDKEVLTSRLIDRTLRPLFPELLRREVQVDVMVLAADGANDADVLALNAAAAAVHMSKAPFAGPVAAIRVGRVEGALVGNPTIEQMVTSDLDFVIAANEERVVMIEGSANQITEEDMAAVLAFAQAEIRPVLRAMEELRSKLGQPKLEFVAPEHDKDIEKAVRAEGKKLVAAMKNSDKAARESGTDEAKAAIVKSVAEKFPEQEKAIKAVLAEIEWETVRDLTIDENKRVDGRSPSEIRPVSGQVGVLPRIHGSAIFQRGQTQALVVITLGTEEDAQRIESLEGKSFKRFMLHYNFPAYSVGEIKPNRGPGRREIGHGFLAEKAFTHVLPTQEEFTYVIRSVSEILESNGSSSQATVCGTSLALFDAGVPMKAPVAGISIGLIQRDGKHVLITDIQGIEDGMGDMDFKVAGTSKGITAIQLDVKTLGVPGAILVEALGQARTARMDILETMNGVLATPRPSLSPHAPRVQVIQVPPDKIGGIIGSGGKTIRKLIADSGCSKIEIMDDTGRVLVVGANEETMNRAVGMIQSMIEEAEVGKVYIGRVSKITDFGAFVEIIPGTDGLVHVSQMKHERVNHPADVVKEGEEVRVKVLEVDPGSGKIRLTMKDVDTEGIENQPRDDRGGGGGGRGGDRNGGGRGGFGGGGRGRGGFGGGGGRGGYGGGGGGGGFDRGGDDSRQAAPRDEAPAREERPSAPVASAGSMDPAPLDEFEDDGPQPGPGAHEQTHNPSLFREPRSGSSGAPSAPRTGGGGGYGGFFGGGSAPRTGGTGGSGGGGGIGGGQGGGGGRGGYGGGGGGGRGGYGGGGGGGRGYGGGGGGRGFGGGGRGGGRGYGGGGGGRGFGGGGRGGGGYGGGQGDNRGGGNGPGGYGGSSGRRGFGGGSGGGGGGGYGGDGGGNR